MLLLVIVLIQVPAVQTYITSQVTKSLEEQWGTRVDVGRVNLTFFETALIEDIYIEDKSGDTLLYAERLKADIGVFALLGKRIVVDEIALENAYINLYRHADSLRFNYEFIADAFTSDTTATEPDTTSGGGFDFDLQKIRLESVRFNFVDDSSKMELRVNAPYFVTEFETLGLSEEHLRIDNIDVRKLNVIFRQPPVEADSSFSKVANIDTTATEAVTLDSAWLNPTGFRYTINNFSIEESEILFQTSNEAEEGKLNFENVHLADLDLLMQDIYVGSDTLRAELEKLNMRELNSNFQLESLAFAVAVEGSIVSARLQEFITANSRLTDEVIIENMDITAGDDLLAKLQVRANIEDAVLSMKDAAYFTDALDTLPNLRAQDIVMDLEFKLAENKAAVDKLELRAKDGFYVNAKAFLENVDNPENLRFDVQLQELTTSMGYIEALSFVEELPQGAAQAGNITLTAQAKGTMDDANLVARLQSGVGRLETNLIYKSPTDNSFLLVGNVDAKKFDLRPFAGDSSGLGTITLTSKIRARGQGEAIDVDKFSLLVQSVEFNNYTYEGLAVEGFFIDSTLEVATAYEDPFLNFDFLLKSDLKDSLPLLIADGNIDKVNLFRLNLMEDSIIISTKLHAELKGQTPDEIRGFFRMDDTEIIRGAKSYTMDSLLIASNSLPGNRREITLDTDFMSASLRGRYLFEGLPLAVEQCANYYCSAYELDTTQVAEKQEIELDFIIRDEPVIARAFVPSFELTYPMTIKASMANELRSFNLEIDAPGIIYESILVKNFTVDAKTTNRVLAFEVASDQIRLSESIDIPDFLLEGSWQQDSVHFNLGLAPPTDPTHLLMGGSVTFPNDTIILELDNTDLSIYGKDYMMADNTIIKYATDYIFVEDFTLQRGEQRLTLFTRDANTPEPKVIAEIREFEVGEFLELAGLGEYGVAATLDGDVKLVDVASLSAIEAQLAVKDILVDSIPAGNLNIDITKVSDNGRLNTDIRLEGPGNDLRISGFYNMEDSTNAISLNVDLQKLRLSTWEPFVKDYLTDVRGSLQGQLAINGTAAKPEIDGEIRFGEQTAFRAEATGALYRLQDQTITINNEEIRFNRLKLIDPRNNELLIAGNIRHENFENFLLDMQIKADNFQLINKSRTLEEAFFGTLFVNTDLEIRGPLEDIWVEGSIKINDLTDLTLVLLDEDRMVGSRDYINFVKHNAFLENDTVSYPIDSTLLEERVDISGFSMAADIIVTPGAEFTIIVDPATGDNLQVSGEADLRITMNPLEGMNMQGVFTVFDGRYRLSFLEVIQKNFDIRKGSTVEFNGDPLDAQLNMTAIYTTETSRYPLVQEQENLLSTAEISAAKKRKPVDVLLSLVGTLENPEFSFDIVVPESEFNMSSAVAQQIKEIKQDQTKLFRQIFGLIVMNRFIPESPSLGGGGGGAEQAINSRVDQSLSAFLTDQLNAISQDYLGVSIEVDVDTRQNIEGQDAGLAEKDVGLQLGRSFWNDRVEVKVGGTTSVGNSGTTVAGGNSGTQFAGNFEILYHINERGNLNLKIFQRNERNFITNEFIPQPGVAVSYTKSFDELEGFFGRARTQEEILKSEGAIEIDPEEEDEEEEKDKDPAKNEEEEDPKEIGENQY